MFITSDCSGKFLGRVPKGSEPSVAEVGQLLVQRLGLCLLGRDELVLPQADGAVDAARGAAYPPTSGLTEHVFVAGRES